MPARSPLIVRFPLLVTALAVSLLAAVPGAGCRNRPFPDQGGPSDAGPDPDAAPVPVTVCEVELAQPATGACDTTPGGGNGVLLRGDVLAPDSVYENGSVLIAGGQIVCVGCDCAGEPAAGDATVLDCPGAAISPGLINPHDHITFTEGAPIDHGITRYIHRHAWRGSLSTPQNPHGTGQTSDGMRWGEMRMAFSGVTAMIGSGRANAMVRNLDRLEARDTALGFQEAEFQTFPLGDANESFRADCGWNFVFDENEVAALPSYLPHIAEGLDFYAAEEFRCQSRSPIGGNNPGAHDHTERNTAHIHSIALQAADYYRMARDGAQIIWSPRSNISLYGITAQVTTFDRFGGVIALGTDWTYSGSANILRELSCADEYNRGYLDRHFTDRQLWEMVTVNAAIAAGTQAVHGTLEPGKLADIAVFAGREDRNNFRAVIEAENADVELVLLAGLPLYGAADTVSELGQSCDPIDVCGEPKAVCATREFAKSFSDIEAAVTSGNAAYPAIFCGPPPGEPTCVPSRPGEFSGDRTGDDADGDGIPDAADNCPRVFNPIRPIDDMAQPDADGDGAGDACDDTPLPDDLDGDGAANLMDNCPFDANGNQQDGDMDLKGDACDFCPATPNPDTVCPLVVQQRTIYDVQMGVVPTGAMVEVTGVVVTGVSRAGAAAQGITVQEPAGGPFSGVFVFTGSPVPAVAIGDVVTVSGQTQEFFELTEISGATVTRTGSTTPLVPVNLTVAEATAEMWEGVLVRLTDVGAVVSPWLCSMDNPACSDANLWQVNGTAGIVVFDQNYQAADWAAHIGVSPITGVMHFRFDRRRIMPRAAADFGM